MAENVNDKTIFSLLDVTKSIQKTISDRYTSSFWVKAEMNKLNFYKQSGHCYPELVEKHNGKVIAQIKACLWKDDYHRSNNKFETVLREPLRDGIKILFLARITFDPAHGLSLIMLDIDPSYTLGDLEREKQDTIKQLRGKGIYNKNQTLSLPLLPQRIAIISVETSKGLADFLEVIETNSWQYQFFKVLFPSLLQGDKAVSSIAYQLKRIKKVQHHFDVVAIIRGGGGDVGLSCYNHFDLAKEIALFPLPVITGIGHATNETVTEMISFYNAITPTKLAEFLLQQFHNFSVPVREAEKRINDKSRRLISEERSRFESEAKLFRAVTESVLINHKGEIGALSKSLIQQASYIFKSKGQDLKEIAGSLRKDFSSRLNAAIRNVDLQNNRLILQSRQLIRHKAVEMAALEKNVINMSPENVLRRGYSISQVKGKVITNNAGVADGDVMETTLFTGKILSIVKSENKNSA